MTRVCVRRRVLAQTWGPESTNLGFEPRSRDHELIHTRFNGREGGPATRVCVRRRVLAQTWGPESTESGARYERRAPI